jgi:hypothetical protein
VERRVKARHRRAIGPGAAHCLQCRERLGLVQRSQVSQLPQPGQDVIADEHSLDVSLSAVDDSMPDRVDRTKLAHRGGDLPRVDRRARSRQLPSATELIAVQDAQL